MITRSLLALALLASQCLAENDPTVRQFGERNEIAVAASQLEGRPQVDPQFAPFLPERSRDVVPDTVCGFRVDPASAPRHRADAFNGRPSTAGEQDGQPERRPVFCRSGEYWRPERFAPMRTFDADDEARLAEIVAKALADLQKCGRDCNEIGCSHDGLDAITRELKRQTFAIERIERLASYGWTAFVVIIVLRLVFSTIKAIAEAN